MLVVFHDIITDIQELLKIYSDLFMRGTKLKMSAVYIPQSYFPVPKTIRLNASHNFIMKIPNQRKHQQIILNHASDMEFKDFMKLCKGYTKEPFSFLVRDIILPSDNVVKFRKNL